MTGTLSNRLAAVGLAAALAFGFAPGAAASPTEKSELAPPAASVLVDATGKVKAKERKKNRTIKVEAKRLEARRTYEVRRVGGTEALAEFTTNRKGKGKAKITEDLPLEPVGYDSRDPADGGGIDDGSGGGTDDGSGGGDGTCGNMFPYGDGDCGGDDGGDPGRGGGYGYYYYYPYPGYCPPEEPRDDEPCSWHCVQVCDKETGEVVLECRGENGNGHGHGSGNGNGGGDCDIPVLEDFELGYADYCADDGSFATVVMQRYDFEGTPYDQFSFSLMVPTEMEECAGWYEWTFYDVYADRDTGLPLGVESVRDLAGRAFEIRDAAGTAFIAGSLPALESLGDIPVWYYPAGGGDGTDGGNEIPDREPPEGDAAFTLWIAGDDGELVEAAAFRTYEVGLPYEPQPGDGGDGTNTLPPR